MNGFDYTLISISAVTFIALIAGFAMEIRKRKQNGEDEDGWYGGSGGGGWTNRPSGRPPNGGPDRDRDMDRQFHNIANAVGRTIEIPKNEKDKVLS